MAYLRRRVRTTGVAATAHSDVRSAAQMLQAGRARTLMTPTPCEPDVIHNNQQN